MKLLQTGDLHLGKLFYETNLLEDQIDMLNQLEAELVGEAEKQSPYDALLLCGDIYDRSIPAADAVCAFSSFLFRIKHALPELTIYIISGNHDSPLRLAYASELLESAHIFIRTNPQRAEHPLILQNGDETLAVYLLPFMHVSASFQDFPTEVQHSQTEFMQYAQHRINEKRDFSIPAILCAHLFTLGALPSEAERSFLGTAEQIDATYFSSFAYTALGHLHKKQKITPAAYYAGSPLAYSFDDLGEKVFLRIELDCKAYIQQNTYLHITEIPVKPRKKLRQLSGIFQELCTHDNLSSVANDYLEIILKDTNIIENPMARLRTMYPFLLSIKQEGLHNAFETLSSVTQRRELLRENEQSIVGECAAFLQDLYGEEAKERSTAEICLFKTIFTEIQNNEST